jgi:hypothetical protein
MIQGLIPSRSKKFFSISKMSRLALEAIQPPVQWVLDFFPQRKQLSCKAVHSPPSSAKVKSEWSYTNASRVCVFIAWIRIRMLYSFFWVIPQCLNFICGHFRTRCSIVIGDVSEKNNQNEIFGVLI